MNKARNNILIFFDGYCNLCNFSVWLILKLEKKAIFRFSPLTSDFSKAFFGNNYESLTSLNSIILIKNNDIYLKSDAVLKITEQFKFPFNYLRYLKYIPKTVRDYIYDLLAKYRFALFCRKKTCKNPTENLKHRFL